MSQDMFDPRAKGKACPTSASMVPATVPQAQTACHEAQLIGYALSHHVPEMRRGFEILTIHGRWHVDAEPAARMAELMRQHLMQQLETI
ncbi:MULTISPECIES: hypothetical protein [Comamonas]|jgi:hypothetical protein|uniref:hypothetical protein n=1 Tax=Comamonas TaxID=283 RepID=UPI0012BF8E7B|nr:MULTISPECIES: hypothetical protein [Comamonas]MDR3065527.1 hypothetical protein [Comamonas sp.]MEB5964747.1 hypothetical protein [Comamonas testosteroni]MPS96877.1 hypothetical protein [Comamonas sp.]